MSILSGGARGPCWPHPHHHPDPSATLGLRWQRFSDSPSRRQVSPLTGSLPVSPRMALLATPPGHPACARLPAQVLASAAQSWPCRARPLSSDQAPVTSGEEPPGGGLGGRHRGAVAAPPLGSRGTSCPRLGSHQLHASNKLCVAAHVPGSCACICKQGGDGAGLSLMCCACRGLQPWPGCLLESWLCHLCQDGPLSVLSPALQHNPRPLFFPSASSPGNLFPSCTLTAPFVHLQPMPLPRVPSSTLEPNLHLACCTRCLLWLTGCQPVLPGLGHTWTQTHHPAALPSPPPLPTPLT